MTATKEQIEDILYDTWVEIQSNAKFNGGSVKALALD